MADALTELRSSVPEWGEPPPLPSSHTRWSPGTDRPSLIRSSHPDDYEFDQAVDAVQDALGDQLDDDTFTEVAGLLAEHGQYDTLSYDDDGFVDDVHLFFGITPEEALREVHLRRQRRVLMRTARRERPCVNRTRQIRHQQRPRERRARRTRSTVSSRGDPPEPDLGKGVG
jgi:hypothetical protein